MNGKGKFTKFKMFHAMTDEYGTDVYGNVIICKNSDILIKDVFAEGSGGAETDGFRNIITCQFHLADLGLGTKRLFSIINVDFKDDWNDFGDRIQQLKKTFNSKEALIPDCIICGNFGICDINEKTQDLINISKFKDVYNSIGLPNELKYTYDTEQNDLSQEINEKKFHRRPDRILSKLQHSKIKMLSLLGIEPINDNDSKTNISTHFGLFLQLIIK